MGFIYAAKWLKKIFGVGAVRKTDIEMAAELGYALRYEDTNEFNLTSILANKLSNIVCSDVGAEIVSNTNTKTEDGSEYERKYYPMREFLDESFRRCFASLNLIAARAFGIGGVVLKPYIYNGAIYTDIIPQNRFFVIEQHGEVVTKACFIAESVTVNGDDDGDVYRRGGPPASNAVRRDKGEKDARGYAGRAGARPLQYTRLEFHTLENGVYTIENKVVACEIKANKKSNDSESEGWEVEFSKSPFAAQIPQIPQIVKITNVSRMLFGFVKCPVDNKRDFSSVYGVPVTYGQEKIIKLIVDLLNEIPDEYKNKKSFIGADDLLFDTNDNLPKNGLYRLFKTMGSVDDAPFWEIFSPEIRHTSYFEGLDYLFGLLEKSVCINQGMLTDLDIGNATATAIKRSTLDTFSTVQAMRRNIEAAFDDLLYAFSVITHAFELCDINNGAAHDYQVQFDWDYRLIEDTGETWKQMLEAYREGAVELHELRMHIFSEDKKTAKAVLDKQSDTVSVAETAEIAEILEDEDDDGYGFISVQMSVRHEVVYDGYTECGGRAIFAPSGRFDNANDYNNGMNPFRRESWNMAEQARIYRENPTIARFLANNT